MEMSANAKQTAINQAAQRSMNRGQFQPFYYYTANNSNGVNNQTVQLHGWPQMAGMPQVFPQFAYGGVPTNFNQYYAQAMQSMQQQNGSGLLANPVVQAPKAKGIIKKEVDTTTKKMVTIQSSSETDSLGLRSKTESENGTHSCDLDKSDRAPVKNNKKQKNRKPVKKMIVVDLPEDLQTIESVTNRCQQYGEILLVRVLKPGKILPFDLKMYSGKIHDLGTTCCAIIEFESAPSASSAVDAEENNLRCALLQQGADLALYGASDAKTTSEHGSGHSSEHTHGESGFGKSSNRDSLSHHSHDDLEHVSNDFVEDTKPVVQKAEISFKPVPAHNNFRPSFLKPLTPKAVAPAPAPLSGGLLATPPKEFELPIEDDISDSLSIQELSEEDCVIEEPKPKQESKVIASTNGRITTALNIKLCAAKPSNNNRNVIKMDLTSQRMAFSNIKASDLLPEVSNKSGRRSPALLSDPSDDMLMTARFSEDHQEAEYKSYNRDLLFSLRECKRALEIPVGLPNIPELMPNRW
jgi:hypothetical protein